MENKENFWSRMKSYGWLYSLLSFILALSMAIYYARDTVVGIISKMTSDIFNIVVIALLFLGVIISFIRWNSQLLRNRLHKLEEKTKKYDEFVEQIKLPKTLDKAITVEISPKWNSPHRQPIIGSIYNKPPHLYFDMRVINRTYHSFEAEEAVAKCFCDQEEVCKGTWDRETRVSETFDRVEDLPKFDDGEIEFHVPIKKLYDNLEKWKLEGTVKYRSKEPLIGEDKQYANPEINIHLEYVLSEKRILELKKEVEKVLGDEQ